MREVLSDLLCGSAIANEKFVVLSGDHGYALFDHLRKERPEQFLNVGIMEQALVGIASGMCKVGFKPVVYGLAAFVPMRCLEQVKLDVCLPNLPVTFLGDGGGVVYSTLGASHHSAEDLACLRPMPNLRIYFPCDAEELRAVYSEALGHAGPTYIRIGKSDRPKVNDSTVTSTQPYFTHQSPSSKICIVATGSMASVAKSAARELGLASVSVPRIKPLTASDLELLRPYSNLVVLEEHSRHGGLGSALTEIFCETGGTIPRIRILGLRDQFAHRCGSYQYVLSEHGMDDAQIMERLKSIAEERSPEKR